MSTTEKGWLFKAIALILSVVALFLILFLWEILEEYSKCEARVVSSTPPVTYSADSESESDNDYNDQNVGELETFVYSF
ncbi:MAG: hypothetical protein ACRC1W_09690 [Shewanella sp.]